MKLKLVYIAALDSLYAKVAGREGYDLWLRYQKVDNSQLLNSYSKTLAKLNFPVNSATLTEAKKGTCNKDWMACWILICRKQTVSPKVHCW